jgi:hypothetical protein
MARLLTIHADAARKLDPTLDPWRVLESLGSLQASLSYSAEYRAFAHIMRRCKNPNEWKWWGWMRDRSNARVLMAVGYLGPRHGGRVFEVVVQFVRETTLP